MKKLNRTVLFLTILGIFLPSIIFTQTSYTDEDIKQLIRHAPKFSDYPEAGAAILLKQTVVNIHKDGSSTVDEHFLVKILRDRGKTEFGDLKRNYNAKTDSMVILLAQSRKRIGKPIPVEAQAINDITPPELANASMYADFRQKVISYPALAPNITIELKKRILHKPVNKESGKYFWGTTSFQTTEPLLIKEYVIIVPKGMKFNYKTTQKTLEPVITEKGDKKVYVWRIEGVPQIIPEENMPPEIAPRLYYSSCPGWKELRKWLWNQFAQKIKVTSAIQTRANELTSRLKSDEEKIQAIFLWVTTRVRNVPLPLGITGYTPNPADSVLKNMYGDWRDKAVLLTALLRASGIKAWPAFVKRSGKDINMDIPSPKQFDGIYVLAQTEGTKLWLEPFADNSCYGYFTGGDNTHALVLRETSGTPLELIPPFSYETNQIQAKGNFALTANGTVTGSETYTARGIFDHDMRRKLKDATPKEIGQFFDQSATTLGEGTIIKKKTLSDLKNLTEPATISWTYSSPDQGIPEENMMIYHLPRLAFDFTTSAPFVPSLEERKYPFYIRRNCSYTSTFDFYLPKGYKIVYMPEKFKTENEFGKWIQSFSVDPEDSLHIVKKRTIILETQIIPLEKYSIYKSVYDKFIHRRNGIILLEKVSQ